MAIELARQQSTNNEELDLGLESGKGEMPAAEREDIQAGLSKTTMFDLAPARAPDGPRADNPIDQAIIDSGLEFGSLLAHIPDTAELRPSAVVELKRGDILVQYDDDSVALMRQSSEPRWEIIPLDGLGRIQGAAKGLSLTEALRWFKEEFGIVAAQQVTEEVLGAEQSSDRFEIDFRGKTPEQVASEFREFLAEKLIELGILKEGEEAGLVTRGTRGGPSGDQDAIEFRFSIPGMADVKGILTARASIELEELSGDVTTLTVDYGNRTFYQDPATGERVESDNDIDLYVLRENDSGTTESCLLTHITRISPQGSQLLGVDARPASTPQESYIIYFPQGEHLSGRDVVSYAQRLVHEYPELAQKMRELYGQLPLAR